MTDWKMDVSRRDVLDPAARLIDYHRVADALGLDDPDVMDPHEQARIEALAAKGHWRVRDFAWHLQVCDLMEQAREAQDAAHGDSNDNEINLLREALATALGLLGLDMPDGSEPEEGHLAHTEADLAVEQKLAHIMASGWPIAFDGCHKLYFLQDAGREAQAREFGYDIYPSTKLAELWADSCGLRFVTRWGYDNDDFAHPWNIEQFEMEEWS